MAACFSLFSCSIFVIASVKEVIFCPPLLMMFIVLIIISSKGLLLCGCTSTRPIASTISIPSTTSPKTVCLPFNQGVSLSVTKNWLPLVAGPLFAIDKIPFLSCTSAGTISSGNLYPGFPEPVPVGSPP